MSLSSEDNHAQGLRLVMKVARYLQFLPGGAGLPTHGGDRQACQTFQEGAIRRKMVFVRGVSV